MGASLHDDIDRDDFPTDKIEDALATSDETGLDLDFHFIDGRDDTDLHIEVDRDAQVVPTAPASRDRVEAATADLDRGGVVSMDRDTSPPMEVSVPGTLTDEVETDAILTEALDTPEFDSSLESDVVTESFEPPDLAVLRDDEFTQRLDLAEQFEDPLDDLVDGDGLA